MLHILILHTNILACVNIKFKSSQIRQPSPPDLLVQPPTAIHICTNLAAVGRFLIPLSANQRLPRPRRRVKPRDQRRTALRMVPMSRILSMRLLCGDLT